MKNLSLKREGKGGGETERREKGYRLCRGKVIYKITLINMLLYLDDECNSPIYTASPSQPIGVQAGAGPSPSDTTSQSQSFCGCSDTRRLIGG